ncbi:MAG: hypothetical protein CVU08_06490 [Bacteroidetes bacterium HGW-Bacteroidetes-3]|jgi:IS30 family transposase|nr:MAG: hypothetical protein CVU08_06490 [Bacteroidetes bacterium HGW-Bacteroidetes-3]
MEVKKHRRLTHKERVQIQTLLNENKSKAYIAKTLNRSRSTITREINKWVQNKQDIYDADLAHWNTKDDYLNKNISSVFHYFIISFYQLFLSCSNSFLQDNYMN